MILYTLSLAIGELLRDYHVTHRRADVGFGRAILKSLWTILWG